MAGESQTTGMTQSAVQERSTQNVDWLEKVTTSNTESDTYTRHNSIVCRAYEASTKGVRLRRQQRDASQERSDVQCEVSIVIRLRRICAPRRWEDRAIGASGGCVWRPPA